MNSNIKKIIALPGLRLGMILVAYAAILSMSLWLSFQLRFDFFVDSGFKTHRDSIAVSILWIIPLKLCVLFIGRQFSGLLAFFSTPDLIRLCSSVTIGSALIIIPRLLNMDIMIPPRGVILIDLLMSLFMLSGFRVACRVFRERWQVESKGGRRRTAQRVAILGAGEVGASLAKELLNKRGLGKLPVAFFDDDANKKGMRIYNIPVLGIPESLEDNGHNLQLEGAVIAMPGAAARRRGEIIHLLQKLHIPFTTVPSMEQMATGQVKVSQLREVEISDLLGRETVEIDKSGIQSMIQGRVLMVTGAGGSIGSELCRQIALFNPSRLLLVDQSEVQLFQIEQELMDRGFGGVIKSLVVDILDELRLRHVFERFQPEIIFHAAAHKHVPMMEAQPSEAIKNNSFGSAYLARLAGESGVERFVMISTDKAINPTNVMGASKRLAEMYVQALAASNGGKTKFMAVRFGNVLGSSGSVIPTFKKQIASGGPVKVTHPDVTRYFMTIPEAVGLVMQSGAIGQGGEIFVLDMGEPVKIVDLARQLIELSGLVPDEDIDIEFVGLRPGEKLFEELQHTDENTKPTEHEKIFCFVSKPRKLEEVEAIFDGLRPILHSAEPAELKLKLKEAVPEYKPYLS
ncbi:polysaccharide biosynthesis protein [Verrucomicrobia bacterium]|nr:polysaccharide biosynthesis protein [Verrucomicrobiota bacterium]